MDEQDKYHEQRVTAAKTKEAMERLIASEGWHILMGIVDGRREALEQQILHKCLEEGNSVYRQEFMKGQAYSLLLISQLPKATIEESSEVLGSIPLDDEDEGRG